MKLWQESISHTHVAAPNINLFTGKLSGAETRRTLIIHPRAEDGRKINCDVDELRR